MNEITSLDNREMAEYVLENRTKFIIFYDNLWGKIYVPTYFEDILKSREVSCLKYKPQLGFVQDCLNINSPRHMRFAHVLGVYFLGVRDLYFLKKHLNINFSLSEIKVFLLSLILHDIGHGPFSHVNERIIGVNHEQLTRQLIKERLKDIIVRIVGKAGFENLIKFMENYRVFPQNSNLYLLGPLFSGFLDCDKKEYVIKDSFVLTGNTDNKRMVERINSAMCLHIKEDGKRVIDYDISVIQEVIEFTNLWYRLYSEYYFHINSVIVEEVYKKIYPFVNEIFGMHSVYQNDFEILAQISSMKNIAKDDIKRNIRIFIDGPELVKGLLRASFNNKEEMELFILKLNDIVPIDQRYCLKYNKTLRMKDRDEEELFFRADSGGNKSFSEEIYGYSEGKEIFYVVVDLELLRITMKENKSEENLKKIMIEVNKLYKELS